MTARKPHPPRHVAQGPEVVDHEGGAAHGDRSRTDFAGAGARKAKRRADPALDVDEAGSPDRLRRRTELRAQSAQPSNAGRAKRVAGEAGSFPVAGPDPRPPPISVIYDPLDDAAQTSFDFDQRSPTRGVPVYGQYPRNLIAKVLPWLLCERREILHVCSGSLPPGEGIRVDVRADAHPDIVADGRALPILDGTIAAVMIDPPYTRHYAKELYGVDYPRPSHLLREAARVVRPGGRIAFVHYITPKPPPGVRFVRAFGLSTGFDMPIRAVSIFERTPDLLPFGDA